MTLNLTTLDANGNYKKTAEMQDLEEKWRAACDVADAEGREHPPLPEKCNIPVAQLADDIELPPVSYPVEGFVEPESEPEDDELDPEPEPSRARNAKRGKRTLEDLKASLPPDNDGSEPEDELGSSRRCWRTPTPSAAGWTTATTRSRRRRRAT